MEVEVPPEDLVRPLPAQHHLAASGLHSPGWLLSDVVRFRGNTVLFAYGDTHGHLAKVSL